MRPGFICADRMSQLSFTVRELDNGPVKAHNVCACVCMCMCVCVCVREREREMEGGCE